MTDYDTTNIPGTPHIDNFTSRPQTKAFDKGYKAIDWSVKEPVSNAAKRRLEQYKANGMYPK